MTKVRHLRVTKLHGANIWRIEEFHEVGWFTSARWVPLTVTYGYDDTRYDEYHSYEDACERIKELKERDQRSVARAKNRWIPESC